ncbi:MAG: 50S ribosomal protein L20 [Planctomycetes bacterium]|nr:50S ribosomal protein L20 [Planctomycetota bacterium]
MPRVKSGAARHRRKHRLLRAARGFRGGRSKLYRTAKEAVTRAGVFAYRDRKRRKREFRGLWITRITAACRMRDIAYSRFIFGLKEAQIIINRKMLSELAIDDPAAFDKLVEIAKQHAAKIAA